MDDAKEPAHVSWSGRIAGASVKWLGPDGGWKTGEVARVNDGGRQTAIFVAGAQLVRDITGELHLVPNSDLHPWPKREDA